MRRLITYAGWILVLGGVIVLLHLCFYTPVRADIWEKLTNETPEAKVKAYVEAVARGDEQGALLVWQLPEDEFYKRGGRLKTLSDRRQNVTRDLVAAGVSADLTVIDVEWWGTCCDPHLAKDPHEAGAARVRVALRDEGGGQGAYVFDVLTRDPYYGYMANYPPRTWVLRDVYPDKEDPLFFPYRVTPESAQPSSGAG